jgi:mannonate dehydratase
MNSNRRRAWVVGTAALGATALAGIAVWRLWPEQGLMNPCLGALPPDLAQHPLVRAAWAGLDPAKVWDCHAHLLGIGDDGDDVGFARETRIIDRPLAAIQDLAFRNAACVADVPAAGLDAALASRLLALAEGMPAGHKLLLLALDPWHDAAGRRDLAHTHFWVGNDYCAGIARRHPERFEWVASVHPHRADASEAIERAVRDGALGLKWIPSEQGIDPASPRCDRAYAALAQLKLPLITHAGEERAAPGDDALGNPLRLRRALEHGVRVVVAHCASMGEDRDLDQGPQGPVVESFALFERMMDESAHVGRLFGDISAITQSARAGRPLRRVLERARAGGDWAQRLFNGSDYPIPALMPLYSPRQLAADGLLDPAAVEPLSAMRRHNALLFDFVLKRHLRLDGQGLADAVFETRRFFERRPV